MAKTKQKAKPLSDKRVDIDRLCLAMNRSRLMLRRFREERREMVRQYVGNHWSEEGTSEKVTVNLIGLYVSVVGRNLIAKNPRVMLSTFDRQNKPAVSAMQTWCNSEIVRMKMQNTLKRVVLDGLFSLGICKVALATPADSASVAWNLVAGQPFAERVDLDDVVFDMHARDFSECSFIGHRYRVPLDAVKDSTLYSNARLSLEPSFDAAFNVEGDERVSMLGRSYYGQDTEEFEDMIDLWEVYLPRHRLVVTLVDSSLSGPMGAGLSGASDGTTKPLRAQKWLGPDGGPYHFLMYGTVPGNAMPKGPIMDLMDPHDAVNRIYRKGVRQAERQKEILAVAGGAMEDGNRIMVSSDGDILRVDNPERSQTRTFGGPDQKNMAFGAHMKDLFGWLAGNLDMMGGLAPQSKTLGQDQMLSQNASRAVADMQDTTVDYTADVLKSLCWYWWHDPFKVMKTKAQLPGLPDMGIQRQVTPQQRMRGRFEELEIEIDPYSMQHSTPQSRAADLDQLVQMITPMMQFLQQQGINFDANAWLQKRGAYKDMPDLPDLLTIGEPPRPDNVAAGGAPPEAPKPAETTRNYVRHSAGQDNQQSRGADFMNQLAAGAGQQNGSPQSQQK